MTTEHPDIVVSKLEMLLEDFGPVRNDESASHIVRLAIEALKAQQSRVEPVAPKFSETFCSQCGGSFGPGDHGYSHCQNHAGKAIYTAAPQKEWLSVPPEPTEAMQVAGASAIRFETTNINKLWTANAVYKAMIEASHGIGAAGQSS